MKKGVSSLKQLARLIEGEALYSEEETCFEVKLGKASINCGVSGLLRFVRERGVKGLAYIGESKELSWKLLQQIEVFADSHAPNKDVWEQTKGDMKALIGLAHPDVCRMGSRKDIREGG